MAKDPWDFDAGSQTEGEKEMSSTAAIGAGGGGLLLGGVAGGVLGYMLGRISHNPGANNFGFGHHNAFAHGNAGCGCNPPVVVSGLGGNHSGLSGYNEPYNNLIQRIDNFEIRGTERNGCLEKDIAINRVKAEYEARQTQDAIAIANANTVNHIDRVNAANIIDRKNDEIAAANRQIQRMELNSAVGLLSCEIKSVGGIAMGAVNAINHLSNCLCECNPKPAPTKVFPDFCQERCEDRAERRRLDEILYEVKQIPKTA